MKLFILLWLDAQTFWTTIGAALLGAIVGSLVSGYISYKLNRDLLKAQHQNDMARSERERLVDLSYRAIVASSNIQSSIWKMIFIGKEVAMNSYRFYRFKSFWDRKMKLEYGPFAFDSTYHRTDMERDLTGLHQLFIKSIVEYRQAKTELFQYLAEFSYYFDVNKNREELIKKVNDFPEDNYNFFLEYSKERVLDIWNNPDWEAPHILIEKELGESLLYKLLQYTQEEIDTLKKKITLPDGKKELSK